MPNIYKVQGGSFKVRRGSYYTIVGDGFSLMYNIGDLENDLHILHDKKRGVYGLVWENNYVRLESVREIALWEGLDTQNYSVIYDGSASVHIP